VAQKIQSQLKVKNHLPAVASAIFDDPDIAAFLAEKYAPVRLRPVLPAPAPAAATAPVAAPVAPVATLSRPALVTNSIPAVAGGVSGLESLFREQLNTMQQLISRQFDVLQGLGINTASVGATPGAAPAGVVAPAATAAPVIAAPAPAPVKAGPAAAAQAAEESRPSRFAVFNPKEAVSTKELSAAQRAHVDT